jgi:hypothetical protein
MTFLPPTGASPQVPESGIHLDYTPISGTRSPPGVKYLLKAAEIQERKSIDYQNPNSSVKQADHYVHGVWTIYDMVHQKMIRIKSLLEAMEYFESVGEDFVPNFEGIEDSAIDAINFLSFLVVYMKKEMNGQNPNRNIFNKEISNNEQ